MNFYARYVAEQSSMLCRAESLFELQGLFIKTDFIDGQRELKQVIYLIVRKLYATKKCLYRHHKTRR